MQSWDDIVYMSGLSLLLYEVVHNVGLRSEGFIGGVAATPNSDEEEGEAASGGDASGVVQKCTVEGFRGKTEIWVFERIQMPYIPLQSICRPSRLRLRYRD